MPIHYTGLPRRSFLMMSLGATASLLTFRSAFADETSGLTVTSNPTEHVALLSDPHIAADITMSARGCFMASNLLRVVADILAQPTKPSFALIDGDCAFNVGLPEDYATLTSLVAAFPAARIPLHMTMGNHDDRYVYGHTHSWNTTQRDSGLHLINLPPIGYVFDETSPLGWVDAELSAMGMQLTLHSLIPNHAEHMKTRNLTWS